ncbi:hypothetical protein A4X13_0g6786 [Tilletia indica]|uniref:Uncharacterized protein n=1 Tax=Tilletia indica TaxID=43049 RepID=A0A177TA54_9BASI|nr:hypothetical protein A4X13_0g6786 [Tilletia indica]
MISALGSPPTSHKLPNLSATEYYHNHHPPSNNSLAPPQGPSYPAIFTQQQPQSTISQPWLPPPPTPSASAGNLQPQPHSNSHLTSSSNSNSSVSNNNHNGVVAPQTTSHSIINQQSLFPDYTPSQPQQRQANPASAVYQLRHFYSAIRARALQQSQQRRAHHILHQQQQQQQQLLQQQQQQQQQQSSSSSSSGPTPQELDSFLGAIYTMMQQSSQPTTTTTSTSISSTTMESDFPPAPVELTSWMLKDTTSMTQAAAAVAALAAATDAETSPVWSTLGDDFSHSSEHDPSPALSDSLTFDELLSSCNPSPLFDDMPYSAVGGGGSLADVPLFGSYQPSSLIGQNKTPADKLTTAQQMSASAPSAMPTGFNDFTLFPEASTTTTTISSSVPTSTSTTTSSMQMTDGSVEYLFQALEAAVQGQPAPSATTTATSPMLWSDVGARPALYPSASAPALTTFQFTPSVTTSPSTSTSVPKSTTTLPDPAPAPPVASSSTSTSAQGNKRSSSRKTSVIGIKRRADAEELLPLDAPIQERSYKTPSATSRKDLATTAEKDTTTTAPGSPFPEDVIPEGLSAMEAKRLSNTLAARRSRHRKAEELRILHETIDSLKEEVQQWKRRCMRAEEERDEAVGKA